MVKCNRRHREKTAYGLVYRSVVVPHDVDAAVAMSKTSVWPSTTGRSRDSASQYGLVRNRDGRRGAAQHCLRLLSVLELTDLTGVTDTKSHVTLQAGFWATGASCAPTRTACSRSSSTRLRHLSVSKERCTRRSLRSRRIRNPTRSSNSCTVATRWCLDWEPRGF